MRKSNMYRNKLSIESVNSILDRMISELSFLWRDAHEQENADLKERKLKQYKELYVIYRRQRLFFIKMTAE